MASEDGESGVVQDLHFLFASDEELRVDLANLSNVDSEEWRAFKLVAQKSLRIAAIHAIADHQFNQLQTAMIKAGIYGCHDDIIRYELVQMPDGRIMPERIYQATLNAPFRTIGAAVWKVFNGEHPMRIPEGAEEQSTYTQCIKLSTTQARVYLSIPT
ncbi:hypothetical protein Ae201684P_021266 [Aphanomyces euteiches]|nr:hypothetical protein Ae201684P_021266 [Aphanomyces euteiches]